MIAKIERLRIGRMQREKPWLLSHATKKLLRKSALTSYKTNHHNKNTLANRGTGIYMVVPIGDYTVLHGKNRL